MNVYIMSGVPACGKSTYVARCATIGDIICSRDEFRDTLRKEFNTTEYFPCDAKTEYERWSNFCVESIRCALDKGVSCWLDQTSANAGSLVKLLNTVCRKLGSEFDKDLIKFQVICIHSPKQTCLERNALRTGYARVPDDVIHKMFHTFEEDEATMITYANILPELKYEMDIDIIHTYS